MVPVIPVDREDLDKVGKLLDESLVVLRLDEVVVPPWQVESLGRGGGGEVHLGRGGGAVPLHVPGWTPVEGLEGPGEDVLGGVDDGPGGAASREVLHLVGEGGGVLLLHVVPGDGVQSVEGSGQRVTLIWRRGDRSRDAESWSPRSRTWW